MNELCPEHGLTLSNDFTCTACQLQLQGFNVENSGRYDEKATGVHPLISHNEWTSFGSRRISKLIEEREAAQLAAEEEKKEPKKKPTKKVKSKPKKVSTGTKKTNCNHCNAVIKMFRSESKKYCNADCFYAELRKQKKERVKKKSDE